MKTKALLVCSSGGHLLQLHRLGEWWRGCERVWVTFRTPDAVSLLADEEVRWAYHPTTRNIPNLFRNLVAAVKWMRHIRPDVIVSTGAGVAVPFFFVGRLMGCKTVYVEVYDRVDLPTLTGRLCYPMTNLFLLQWPDQKRFYRKGKVIGRLL